MYKLTYSTMFDPPAEMHTRFDAALADVRSRLGAKHALHINGEDVHAQAHREKRSPIDRNWLLGSFSQATAAFPGVFPPLYVATMKAAERTGDVPEALGRYIAYAEELERVKKKIVSASIYPAIVLAVGVLVLGFLMLYVVPRFARVYEDMAGSLPFFSKVLLAFGSFVGANALLVSGIALACLGLAAWAFTRPQFRGWVNTRLWQAPAVGEIVRDLVLDREPFVDVSPLTVERFVENAPRPEHNVI